MLALISPAKRLDFQAPSPASKHSLPGFLQESKTLISELRKMAPAEIARLMHISADLADLNHQRYAQWHTPFDARNAKAAVFAFNGDVYMGLQAHNLTTRDITWMQKRVRILSGLYGLLRPLDLIQPYRLEMGTALQTTRGTNLYGFWGETITDAVNQALQAEPKPILINLASQEYYASIDPARINARIITPTFKERRDGEVRFISFSAKKARGLMVRYMVQNRISSLKGLKGFNSEGYTFSEAESQGDHWVFLRDAP